MISDTTFNTENNMNIGIIGAGWYGCHIALSLKREGHNITLLEKNNDIFQGISGNFGIRLHKGPHYPRSDKTRQTCRTSFDDFYKIYPELIVEHEYSIYALGTKDAFGVLPKVDKTRFLKVCNEAHEAQEINLDESGYDNLQVALTLDEPSIAIGHRVRGFFKQKLLKEDITVQCNFHVQKIDRNSNKTTIHGSNNEQHTFDLVINATSFQSFVPTSLFTNFPIDMEVVYQPCLGLIYQDTQPKEKPISFIVMDGWFPCLMPCIDEDPFQHHYLLTHGSYTILGSLPTQEEAYDLLNQINDDYILNYTKPKSEFAMNQFWPDFKGRFSYDHWKGTVLAKIKTKSEFRSSVVFEYEGMIQIIPGKVSNVFDAEREIMSLITNIDCMQQNDVRFVRGGVLDQARHEIEDKPATGEANTCNLNTYIESKKIVNNSYLG